MGVVTQLVAYVKSVDIHEKTVKLNVAILLVSHSTTKGWMPFILGSSLA